MPFPSVTKLYCGSIFPCIPYDARSKCPINAFLIRGLIFTEKKTLHKWKVKNPQARQKKNFQWNETVFHINPPECTFEVHVISILQMGKLRLVKVSQLLGRIRPEYSLV